jgi:hypothetical protein
MQTLIDILKKLQEIGIWNIINVLILISVAIIGYRLIWSSRKRFKNFYIFFTWRENINRFNHVIHIQFRNLSDQEYLITDAYFKTKNIKVHNQATQDSVSGEYELKFRKEEKDTSDPKCIIKAQEFFFTYLPIDDSFFKEEIFQKKFDKEKILGYMYFTITELEAKPKIQKFKCPIKNVKPFYKYTTANMPEVDNAG